MKNGQIDRIPLPHEREATRGHKALWVFVGIVMVISFGLLMLGDDEMTTVEDLRAAEMGI